jgi:hypothetical protein
MRATNQAQNLPVFWCLNSKNSKFLDCFLLVRAFTGGAWETRLPVGNQISRPVTKTLLVEYRYVNNGNTESGLQLF